MKDQEKTVAPPWQGHKAPQTLFVGRHEVPYVTPGNSMTNRGELCCDTPSERKTVTRTALILNISDLLGMLTFNSSGPYNSDQRNMYKPPIVLPNLFILAAGAPKTEECFHYDIV